MVFHGVLSNSRKKNNKHMCLFFSWSAKQHSQKKNLKTMRKWWPGTAKIITKTVVFYTSLHFRLKICAKTPRGRLRHRFGVIYEDLKNRRFFDVDLKGQKIEPWGAKCRPQRCGGSPNQPLHGYGVPVAPRARYYPLRVLRATEAC